MHPEGNYDARIIDHGATKSKTGTEQIAVQYRTQHGEITAWFPLTDRSVEYTIDKLLAMGFLGTSLSQLNDGACLVGKTCNITVRHEEYQGETRPKVSAVRPEGDEGGATVNRDDSAAKSIERFDALLRKRRPEAAPTSAPRKRLPDPSPGFTPAEDDEIPF